MAIRSREPDRTPGLTPIDGPGLPPLHIEDREPDNTTGRLPAQDDDTDTMAGRHKHHGRDQKEGREEKGGRATEGLRDDPRRSPAKP